MAEKQKIAISHGLRLALFIFVAQVLEEAPGFAAWASAHFTRIGKSGRVSLTALAGTAVPGAIPMLLHGYLILFRGDRLF